jgi:PAS domain S-box-containing protein
MWLDPASYAEKRAVPPPITIQSISANDKFYEPDPRLKLPAHTSSVQISYAAVSLSDPEAIRFRYKLQEADKDWHEAAAATPVTYRNLPPGSYHFSVEASDTNGVWSGAPAHMAFTILPAFYQTIWFRLLCVAAFLALLWELYRLRVQQLRGEERRLREAIETIPAMAWISGPDGTIHFVNRRWVDYTGLSQLGKVGEIGRIAIHPEDLDRSTRRMGASSASGEPFEDEMRFRRTDGEYRWFLSRAVPLRDKRGKVVKWYGAANRHSRSQACGTATGRPCTHQSGQHNGRNGRLHLARTRTAPYGDNRSCQGISTMASAGPARFDGGSQRDGKNR